MRKAKVVILLRNVDTCEVYAQVLICLYICLQIRQVVCPDATLGNQGALAIRVEKFNEIVQETSASCIDERELRQAIGKFDLGKRQYGGPKIPTCIATDTKTGLNTGCHLKIHNTH